MVFCRGGPRSDFRVWRRPRGLVEGWGGRGYLMAWWWIGRWWVCFWRRDSRSSCELPPAVGRNHEIVGTDQKQSARTCLRQPRYGRRRETWPFQFLNLSRPAVVVLTSCHPSIRFHRSPTLRMPKRPVGWLSSHLCDSGPVARLGNV